VHSTLSLFHPSVCLSDRSPPRFLSFFLATDKLKSSFTNKISPHNLLCEEKTDGKEKIITMLTKTVDTSTQQPTKDVEMNTTSEGSQTVSVSEASPDIPSRMDVFYDFNGSLGFAIGSSGFILSMYFENWLPYFRYGCIVWIWGCIFYSIPLLLKFKNGCSDSKYGCTCPWGIGDLGEFLCFVFYTIGCVLGGFYDEEAVENFLPAINHTFVYGSFSLVLEPLYQAFLFLKRGGSCRSRMSASKLCGSPDTITDDDKEAPLKLNWDRCLELGATTFFCAAGVFGGFPPHPSLALPGVYFWEVGSLFSVARSCLMVHSRKVGLKAQAASNKSKVETARSGRNTNATVIGISVREDSIL